MMPLTYRQVFFIVDAYESGYGHGLARDKLGNPYPRNSAGWHAYHIGYEKGYDHATEIEAFPGNRAAAKGADDTGASPHLPRAHATDHQ